jgi:hypothetical protein
MNFERFEVRFTYIYQVVLGTTIFFVFLSAIDMYEIFSIILLSAIGATTIVLFWLALNTPQD